MPTPNPAALDFLQTRRSRPAKTLGLPVPDRAALRPLLRAAGLVPEVGARMGKSPEDIAKAQAQFADAHLAVAVIESPKASEKIPSLEQTYSAGCVCLGLLNAALAAGWGANWLSGWASHDRGFATTALGLAPHERIAGFIHIGTETSTPPERPRPDLDAVTEWMPE